MTRIPMTLTTTTTLANPTVEDDEINRVITLTVMTTTCTITTGTP
jgi:hypothetical protein